MKTEEFEKKLHEDLTRYLVANDEMDRIVPQCPDVEELWPGIAEAYLPDGVREYRDYPTVSLGWPMFIGMALANFWDIDWEKWSKTSPGEIYGELRDTEGFDNLDDYVVGKILGLEGEKAEKVSNMAARCAALAHHALLTCGEEPGTPEAMKCYIAAVHQLYLAGMATELYRLGYKMHKLS
ncbi:MAG: hypothetical protein NC336_08730 [Clostridium sp.]|nr:hypothetical protein [Clostridium sp.]